MTMNSADLGQVFAAVNEARALERTRILGEFRKLASQIENNVPANSYSSLSLFDAASKVRKLCDALEEE